MTDTITPLQVRSAYSLLRGTTLPETLVAEAAALGHEHLAITDVNTLAGITRFWSAGRSAGVGPLVGAELCRQGRSVLAMVENESGYENLCRLVTAVCAERFSFEADIPPRSEGLALVAGDAQTALALSGRCPQLWMGIDPVVQGRSLAGRLAVLAAERSLPVAAVGTVLCAGRIDRPVAQLLAAVRLGVTFDDVPPRELPASGASFRSREELHGSLVEFPGAIAGNRELVERCEGFELLPRRPVFPMVELPAGITASQYLRALCHDGLDWRYGIRVPREAPARLDRELALIEAKGFCEYFLVVRDIVLYARRKGAPVAARGSGGGSLAAYLLGITNVCPLAYGIGFERFINEGRRDLPDLDIDFCWRIRDDVLNYALTRWGEGRAAMVSTHCTFGSKSALRETAKAMGFSNEQISHWPENVSGPVAQRVEALAARLVGLPHNFSVHPGGVVLGRKPIDHYVPVQSAAKGVRITQLDKDGIEAIGLVKLDLLGNRSLSTIREACDLVSRRRGVRIDPETVPPDDTNVSAMLQSADTVGCNQIESPAMRHLLGSLRPQSPRDLMQALALIRPGAAAVGMKEAFVRRRRGLDPVPKGYPPVDALLGETSGVMLYEDDVLAVAAAMLDCDVSEADRFRKAVQKCRDDTERQSLSKRFLDGCRKRGVPDDFARSTWVQMAKFNAYSFCRAHAAAYAQLAWAVAFLKTYFAPEFWTAALNNNQSMYHRRVYIEQARRAGVALALPDVNRSGVEFTLDGGTLRAGLGCIAGIGPGGAARVIEARSRGAFQSVSDCLLRSSLGREEARNLIRCGAMDALGTRRSELMMEAELFLASSIDAPDRGSSMLVAPRAAVPATGRDYDDMRKYFDERSLLGFSVREHIMAVYRPQLSDRVDTVSKDLSARVGRTVRIAGVLEARREAPSRNGKGVVFLTLDDEWGLFEAAVFAAGTGGEDTTRTYGPHILTGRVQSQYGTVTLRTDNIETPPLPVPRHCGAQRSGGSSPCGLEEARGFSLRKGGSLHASAFGTFRWGARATSFRRPGRAARR